MGEFQSSLTYPPFRSTWSNLSSTTSGRRQLLAEDNFSSWIDSMNAALQIKNKIWLVDGTLPKPQKNPKEQNQWNRCDILVKTWLKALMSKEIGKSFSHCRDSRTVWLELHERFGQTNIVQLIHIENSIHNCTQGSLSITSFFTQLKSLWDEKEALCNFPACVCDAGDELKTYIETQKTMKFLMGLTDEFATTRSNIICMDPLPNLNKVYSMALRHEKQASISASKIITQPLEAVAFYVQQSNLIGRAPTKPLAACSAESHSKPFACYVRKQGRGSHNSDNKLRCSKCDCTNHYAKNCKAHLRCTICNGKGHIAEIYSFCNF